MGEAASGAPTYPSAPHTGTTTLCFATASGAAAIASVVFTLWPDLDLITADAFYLGAKQFIGQREWSIGALRQVALAAFVACCTLSVAGIVFSRILSRQWLGLDFTRWIFFAACLTLGPGLVTNVIFKDQWGRARPHQVVEFGGAHAFTPPLLPSNQCDRNCSFVSGEASSMFMIFFAAAFVFRRRARALFMAGIAAGTLTGLIRMAQGAHFLSDVIFAGVLMALTAAAVNALFRSIAGARHGTLLAVRKQ